MASSTYWISCLASRREIGQPRALGSIVAQISCSPHIGLGGTAGSPSSEQGAFGPSPGKQSLPGGRTGGNLHTGSPQVVNQSSLPPPPSGGFPVSPPPHSAQV